ncbi:MAG: hypothetical protein JO100_08805 [Pseudonocardia sp.]|jgi:hypothetical protein|nr:hypothetical protein [Pseudonocardia sp.]
MTLFWIGDAVLILVVAPVVVLLLHRLTVPVVQIGKHVRAIDQQADGLVTALGDVPMLLGTRDRVTQVSKGLARYVDAVERVL